MKQHSQVRGRVTASSRGSLSAERARYLSAPERVPMSMPQHKRSQAVEFTLLRFWIAILAVLALILLWLIFPDNAFSAVVSAEDLKAKILSQVNQDIRKLPCMHGEEDVQIQITHFPYSPFVFPEDAADSIKVTVDTGLSAVTYTNTPLARVTLTSPSGRIQNFGVPLKITVLKPVWMVKNAVLPGQALSSSDFIIAKQDVSRQLPYTVGTETRLTDYVARINLRPGGILDTRQIVRPPAVHQFTNVNVVFNQKTGSGSLMTIRFLGVALQDGQIGQVVRVKKQFDRPKYYSGKVIDRNTVLVEM